ncbi:acetyl-CoA carboxylase biotin carboxyl carrier protein [uncultured Paludibaculum sp.]|uniref:acetyl-CoA carboxylase biotin carboxyl carrier protein n=1 Tax=uncultured Paludibaculum sp. TaxID=1765020 RepID=UPI002AABD474|nr:acetyl-CoA carboxylase biotin carboxyl carrier protein [uncultured Paludibaculum sp.]
MTIEEIRELIQTVCSTGVAELEVQRGDNRVWIKRTAGVVTQEIHVPQQSSAPAPAPVQTGTPSQVTVAAPSAQPAPGEPDLTDPTLEPIKSPIVGTFYAAGAPGAENFVKVGDTIKPGKVLCIIESMKLMNEIEAEVSGTIVKRLVENGQPVEYGEVLFLVKPS